MSQRVGTGRLDRIIEMAALNGKALAEQDDGRIRIGTLTATDLAIDLRDSRAEAASLREQLAAARRALDYAVEISRGVGEHIIKIAADEDMGGAWTGDPGFRTRMTEYSRIIGDGIADAIEAKVALLAADPEVKR
jgi:hypothetical protein